MQFLGIPGKVGYGISQLGEAADMIGKIKAVWDLADGDWGSAIIESVPYVAEGGGKLQPGFGALVDLVSIVHNFSDAFYIYTEYDPYIAPYPYPP